MAGWRAPDLGHPGLAGRPGHRRARRGLGLRIAGRPAAGGRDPVAEIDLTHVAALAFTSVNGVEAFARLSAERRSPVFAVGDRTARAAREAGFADVVSADGDVEALAALIAGRRGGRRGAVGRRQGTGRRPGLAPGGGPADRPARGGLRDGRPRSVARDPGPAGQPAHGAAAFAARGASWRRWLRQAPAPNLRALCLSTAVAAPLLGLSEQEAAGPDVRAAPGRNRAAGPAHALAEHCAARRRGARMAHDARSRSR
jgi:uroporphyrinogen-III synthase